MSKLLLLSLAACLGWYFWRRLRLPDKPAAPPAERPAERMVACAHCGVNVPEGESLRLGLRHYCCAAHQRAAGADRGED